MDLTNREIACRLRISETTFSYIINNKPGIGDKTRARVTKEIVKLGYGHLLRKDAPFPGKNICFVIHKRHGGILNQAPYYLFLMEQIEEQARKAGFNLNIRTIDTNDMPETHIKELNQSGTSGLIVFATEMLDDDMEHYQLAEMPVVSMDNDFTHLGFDSVVINNRAGTYKAVEYLVKNGHKKIGYLQCKTYIGSFAERDEGYQSALRCFGIELPAKQRFRIGYLEEESYRDFKKILAGRVDLPSALVSDDDTLSVGAMRALIEYGVSVPEEVSLMGFDDRPVCQLTQPQLTTIASPRDSFGVSAVDLLVDRIAHPPVDKEDYRKVAAGIQLIIRESVSNKINPTGVRSNRHAKSAR